MNLLTTLSLLAAAVSASPITTSSDSLTTRASANTTDSKNFHLKTTNAADAAHNNLYVYAYHTGAGLNDAVLTKTVDDASPAFLNGTNVQFDLESSAAFPWGLKMTGASDYGAWESVQIDASYGTPGFSIEGGNLKWSEKQGFGGWLVCDWSHNEPQLFYLYKPLQPKIPSSCSKVDLQAEYV